MKLRKKYMKLKNGKTKLNEKKYKPENYTYFSNMKRAFGDNIYNNKINID